AAHGIAKTTADGHLAANREAWMKAALAPALAASDAKYLPGGTHFDEAIADIRTRAIPAGANFLDRTNMYHFEGMYNFKNEIDPEVIELLAGANYRIYDLNSEGTLFTQDSDGNEFDIHEWGAYVQAAKQLGDNFKLT